MDKNSLVEGTRRTPPVPILRGWVSALRMLGGLRVAEVNAGSKGRIEPGEPEFVDTQATWWAKS